MKRYVIALVPAACYGLAYTVAYLPIVIEPPVQFEALGVILMGLPWTVILVDYDLGLILPGVMNCFVVGLIGLLLALRRPNRKNPM